MKRLLNGKESCIPKVKVRDLVIVKPRSARMFGSQPPRPSAAPKNAKKDHRGDNALFVPAEHHTHGIALDIGGLVHHELGGRCPAAEAHSFEEIERPPPLTVRDQPARRLWECKAQGKYHQSAKADNYPDPTPADGVPKAEGKQRTQRPHTCAADELHEGGGSSADALWGIFRDVGKARRRRRAEPDPCDQATKGEPKRIGCEGCCDRRQTIEQHAQLIDPFAAQTIGELALTDRADEKADDLGGPDCPDFGRRGEMRPDHVRH
jgi:hypothetical protein